jgi:hypothetical protein
VAAEHFYVCARVGQNAVTGAQEVAAFNEGLVGELHNIAHRDSQQFLRRLHQIGVLARLAIPLDGVLQQGNCSDVLRP